MAIERVVSPFAASKRSIKRLEEKARLARMAEQRKGREAYERRAIVRRREQRIRTEAAEKALRQEKMDRFKADLLESIRLDKPSGMFAQRKPSINKVVVHSGKEGMDFDPSIDQGHLRELAARSNALNMLVTGQAQADKMAAASLSPDFYPQDFFKNVGAEPNIFGLAPDEVTPPLFDPAQGIASGETQVPPFQGDLPQDLDLTNLFQGQEFVGEEEPPPKMQHLFKMIDMFQAFQGQTAPKPSTTEEKVAQIRGAGGGNTEVLRALGALEKPATGAGGADTVRQIMEQAGMSERSKEIFESTQMGKPKPTAGRAKGRGEKLGKPDTEEIRTAFMDDTGLEPTSIEFENGTIIVYVGNRKFVLNQ